MDNPPDRQKGDDAPAMPEEAQLRTVMEQSDADLAVGLTVPLADVLAELNDVAQTIEVRRRARRAWFTFYPKPRSPSRPGQTAAVDPKRPLNCGSAPRSLIYWLSRSPAT